VCTKQVIAECIFGLGELFCHLIAAYPSQTFAGLSFNPAFEQLGGFDQRHREYEGINFLSVALTIIIDFLER